MGHIIHPPTESRRDKNARLYREAGWHPLTTCPGPTTEGPNASTLEWWVGPNGRMSIVQVWNDHGGINNYFIGGGHEWHELEPELRRVCSDDPRDEMRAKLRRLVEQHGIQPLMFDLRQIFNEYGEKLNEPGFDHRPTLFAIDQVLEVIENTIG